MAAPTPSAANRDPESQAPEPMTRAEACRYRVFLSYSHADAKWARWLMRRLEGYRVPAKFAGRCAPIGRVGRRIAPVFRDRDELPTAGNLGETIRAALQTSATLVVICSPQAAQSRWVDEEIRSFKRLHGENAVFAFIIGGEPKVAGAANDCFPPALRRQVGPDGELAFTAAEVVAADARAQADGPKLAFVRLVAGLLGVGFDELRQRELQRRNRRLTLITACSLAAMVLTIGLATAAYQARNDAQRRQGQAEEVLAFMLGDFRAELRKLGRLSLLDAVGEKALAYFSALDARDLTDTALAQQAKMLTQIGEIRMEQARYAEAAQAFLPAYERAAALARRHPRNGDMLFHRGQAEYWIGFVHWRRRDLEGARTWFTRYRDTGVEQYQMDPKRIEWQGELAYGHHNLAVLDLDEGRLDAARRGFEDELRLLVRMAEVVPEDLALRNRTADVHSWLGTVAERSGDYAEAVARLGGQVLQLEAIVARDPRTARWQARLADALGLHASILAATGQRAASLAQRTRAKTIYDRLTATDPQNRTWMRHSLSLRVNEARLLRADGELESARLLVVEARHKLESLAAAEPTDGWFTARLAGAWRLEGELEEAAGRSAAAAAIRRAGELSEQLVSAGKADEAMLGEAALALIAAGSLAARAGNPPAASGHWERALQVLQQARQPSTHWRILDPTARALALLGREAEAREIIESLHSRGYRPLEPWPAVNELRLAN
jgi:eukaryotic-like serine/threonine-protein kinase